MNSRAPVGPLTQPATERDGPKVDQTGGGLFRRRPKTMRKFQLAFAASMAISSAAVPAFAQSHHKHRTLKTVAAGVAGYELAKHSHNRFLHKHRFAAGVVGAMAAHHYMKKHHH